MDGSESVSKLWLLAGAFVAGCLITPLILIATSGEDEPNLPPATYATVPLVSGLDQSGDDRRPTPAGQPTATPAREATAPPPERPAPTPVPERPAPTPVPERPAPTPQPQVAAPNTPAPPSSGAAVAPLTGRFRIIDTITEGAGAGTTISFEVTLRQDGSTVSGGNSELQLMGDVQGATFRAQFVQPALGYTGSFVWALQGRAGSGTFTSSVPNSGVSQLVPL